MRKWEVKTKNNKKYLIKSRSKLFGGTYFAILYRRGMFDAPIDDYEKDNFDDAIERIKMDAKSDIDTIKQL